MFDRIGSLTPGDEKRASIEDDKLIPFMEKIWLCKDYDPNAPMKIFALIIENERYIVANVEDANFKKRLKKLVTAVLPGHVYQVKHNPEINYIFDIFPDVGAKVLRQALDLTLTMLNKSCFSIYSGCDPNKYCEYIRDMIEDCEKINIPWVKMKETIFLETPNGYRSQSTAFKECIETRLNKRAKKWHGFAGVHSDLTTEIKEFPRHLFQRSLQRVKPKPEPTSFSANPLINLWDVLLEKFTKKLSSAAVELFVVLSAFIRAMEKDDLTTAINVALAGIKICGASSNLPVFFGGKNRASSFASLLGISFTSTDENKFIPDFCRVQFEAMERIPNLYRSFKKHAQSSPVFGLIQQYIPTSSLGIELQSFQMGQSLIQAEEKRNVTSAPF